MKRRLTLAIVAASTLGAAAAVDKLADLKARMDTLQDTRDDLRDALDANDGAKAVQLSKQVEQLLQQDQQLWQGKGLEDVLRINQATIQLAQTIQKQAAAADKQHALETYIALQKSCASCHDLHPEKRLP